MLEYVKHCAMCGKIISDLNDPHTDYLRHIRVKYCDSCRNTKERIQTRNRVEAFRERKKQKEKMRDEQLKLLGQKNELLRHENELLYKRVQQLREETTRHPE